MYDYDAKDEQDLPPSKSELKRQMQALQELGKKLLDLTATQLTTLNLDEELLDALEEHKRIKSHEAKRRHLQRIGKLMRSRDSQKIQAAMDIYDSSSSAHAQHFQNLEYWRDRLIAEDSALAEFVELWPECEVQLVRQLIRNTRKEAAADKPPASSRKLFRYMRKLADPS
ncbi:UPF0307 protein [Marinospirillum insulare]|uniref:Dual-action ribosomal maturation protein DarP n=2 Tax=Marinospirillum insulare TaxID=217169 RepID=A0ABQ5ZXW8_9GAMM|nr:UPF0307 protein [Marinospirillum insulare]